jgi:tetratricopeptide (TPR) repeat protein
MLKVFLNHLAGYIHNGLQEYDKAIQHFETVLPVEEQLLGSKQYFLLFAQFVLAKCYTQTEKFEEALQLLDKLLRNGFQSSQSSDILNSPRSEMPQGVAIPHQNSFVMGQLRKRIEQIHDSRSALSSYNINVMTLEIDTYNWHGYVLQHLGRLQEALRSFQRSLELGCKIVEGLKSDDLRVENARIQMLDACDWKARLHHEERRYEDAAKAALEYQDIYQKVRSSKIDVYEDAMHKILCGYIFGENPGKFGFSVQFAKDAMKASVIAACQAFGSTECTEELDCWYNEAEDMLDINNLPSSEDKSDPFNREIEAYKRFLDLYVDLHKQEPLRSLHSDYPSFSRYYQLGVLCYRAEQILNAVEAMKRCIQICEELWSPMPEQMLFSYYVLSWIELSSYYGRLGHVSKSAKSIRRALDLTEEFPGNLENFAYSMDRMVEMVEIADQRLKDARQKRRKARHKCRTLHRLRALQSFWLDSSKVAANGSESKKGHSQGEEPRIREEGRGTRYGTLSVSKGSGPWWRTRKLHGIHVKIALRRSLAKQKPKTVDRADSSKYTHEGAG